MITRKSLGWPITLGVIMIVLLVALIVGWVVVNVSAGVSLPNPGVYWAILAVGCTFFTLLLVGVVLYLLLTVKAVRLNQRQSNFIDSVTHELKSPLASLKLYLQTLTLRPVNAQQQAEFHRFMLQDVERLDSLIDHLLDVARLDRQTGADAEQVALGPLLTMVAETACRRYRLPLETISLPLESASVLARPADLEMIFRNIIDNAIKYSGETPRVEISVSLQAEQVVTRIADNGRGIPAKLRRKMFGRFVRLGSELQREQTGTGLGLYIVRTLVKRLHGTVSVSDRGELPGAAFEVRLPAVRTNASEGVSLEDANRPEKRGVKSL